MVKYAFMSHEMGDKLMNDSFLVFLTTNKIAAWYIKNIASKLDLVIATATNGRFTSMCYAKCDGTKKTPGKTF